MTNEEAIRAYVRFSANQGIITDKLQALLPAFEKAFLQSQKVSYTFLIKSLSSFIFKEPFFAKPIYTEGIIFWPFQLHHCDFMMPLIEELNTRGVCCTVLVHRNDIFNKLADNGIASFLIPFNHRMRSLRQIIIYLTSVLKAFSEGFFMMRNKRWYHAFLITLQHLGAVENTQAALGHLIPTDGEEAYHMVGYDLSILGRVITRYCVKNCLWSGRIQNGAPNYLLSGYSEVKELFLWNELSKQAYVEKGFQGKIHLTGNILLHHKIKTGPSEEWLQWLSEQPAKQCQCFVALSGPGHNTSEKGHKKTLQILQQIIDQSEDCRFFIKLHPKDSMKFYQGFNDKPNIVFTDKLEVSQKPDALDVLLVSEILITGASTVAINALDLAKVVISIDPLKELNHFGFLNEEKVLNVYGAHEINQAIKKISFAGTCSPSTKTIDVSNPVDQIVRHLSNFEKTKGSAKISKKA